MELNRNQWFLLGLVLLLVGIQFRMVDSFVLTPEMTKFVADQTGHPIAAAGQSFGNMMGVEAVAPKTVRPPEWIGWSFLSFGAVLILHALSMRKPE